MRLEETTTGKEKGRETKAGNCAIIGWNLEYVTDTKNLIHVTVCCNLCSHLCLPVHQCQYLPVWCYYDGTEQQFSLQQQWLHAEEAAFYESQLLLLLSHPRPWLLTTACSYCLSLKRVASANDKHMRHTTASIPMLR